MRTARENADVLITPLLLGLGMPLLAHGTHQRQLRLGTRVVDHFPVARHVEGAAVGSRSLDWLVEAI